MFYDTTYWLYALPGAILGLWAQMKLSAAYGKYSRVGIASGRSGAEAAREILDHAGLDDVPVHEVGGHLTDYYDPGKRALCLSSENFHGRSLAAVGVAAHEAGHALQHQAAYAPLSLRMAIVPVTRFASIAWIGILIAGALFAGPLFPKFILLAVAIFSITAFFQLVTLPVEFDASRRAKEQLLRLGLVQSLESEHVSKVLSAAALTYVAALVGSILELLYFLSLAQRSRN